MASCAHEVWLVRAGYLFFSVEIFLPSIKIVLRRLSYFKFGFGNSYFKDCDWRSKDSNQAPLAEKFNIWEGKLPYFPMNLQLIIDC